MLASSYSCLATTIATNGLNFCVRNGNRCTPAVKTPTQKTQFIISEQNTDAGLERMNMGATSLQYLKLVAFLRTLVLKRVVGVAGFEPATS